MATVQRFEGPSLDDVLAQVRLALGDDAEIIEANRIKASGVIGSDRYEVKARRAQRGQRRADRQAADAHVNPMSGAGAGRGEAYPGGLDDATVQAAMDHVQQVMADLERKRIAQDHADAPSPTSLVDLADQVVDDSPAPAFGSPNLGDDPSFAALLAEARANAKANAPKVPMEWPELEALSGADTGGVDDAGTVEWEPLDWSARRVRTADPNPVDPPVAVDLDALDENGQGDDDFGPALLGEAPQADASDDDTYGIADDVLTDDGFMGSDGTDDTADLRGDIPAEDGDETDEEAVDVEVVEAAQPASLAATLFGNEAIGSPAPAADGEPVEPELLAPESFEPESFEPEAVAPGGGEPTAKEAAEDEAVPEGAVNIAAEDTETVGTTGVDTTGVDDAATDDAHGDNAVSLVSPDSPGAEAPVSAPIDEVAESTQTGWVDADREFMGVWTDEAEHEDAGWFATGEPDDEVQEFATLRNHRLVEWLSRNDLTPEALNQALEGLPRPDDLPPGPGVIIAVVGEGPLVLPLARRIAVDLEADPAKVVLASEHRSHASVPDNCRISSADEAALDRRAWRRRSSATLVAVDTSTSLAANAQDWACDVLESLQPHQVIALVDAGRKAEDVARWIADLGGIDAIALSGLEETVSPHAILELGIPVARLGTQVATPRAWSALLRNRREPVE